MSQSPFYLKSVGKERKPHEKLVLNAENWVNVKCKMSKPQEPMWAIMYLFLGKTYYIFITHFGNSETRMSIALCYKQNLRMKFRFLSLLISHLQDSLFTIQICRVMNDNLWYIYN